MIIRVLSVPHTGTRFTHNILRRAGFKQEQYANLKSLPVNEDKFIHHHFWGNPQKYNFEEKFRVYGNIFEYNHLPTIIPLRNYNAVEESYVYREKDLNDLRDGWNEMNRFLEKPHPEVIFFRLDDPIHRDGDLLKISQLIGRDLHVNWSEKVGHKTRHGPEGNPAANARLAARGK